MRKLLFVNACIRENSRTEKLSRQYLNKMEKDYQIEEIRLLDLELKPFDAEMLKQRDEDISLGRLDKDNYQLSRQFADADCIVIAAPYWDCLFPAILRVYLEHVCVTGITFAYGENGMLVKTCHADRLVYITTCGGFLPEKPAVEEWIQEMGKLFSIDDVRFYAAEGLDIFPDQVEERLDSVVLDFSKSKTYNKLTS